MISTHCALIVEDQLATAEDLANILESMDCEPFIVSTRDGALDFLESHRPCVVLLDLSIPAGAHHIKGRPNVGISLLQELRKRFGSPRMQTIWLPIIVVSGHANEVEKAVELMKLEADDLIEKPYKEETVVRKVREALVKSGRATHAACGQVTLSPTVGLLLEIPGRSVKRRTVVRLGGRELHLTDSELCVLLHLLVGREKDRQVPLLELGNNTQLGYKRVDRLRKALAGVVENPTSVIVIDGGTYTLSSSIAVGAIDMAWLASRSHAEIARLAGELNGSAPAV